MSDEQSETKTGFNLMRDKEKQDIFIFEEPEYL